MHLALITLLLVGLSSSAKDQKSYQDLVKYLAKDQVFVKQFDKWVKDHKLDQFEDSGYKNFDCPILKSKKVPTSAHKLMPGDIKVVAAIGDSLSAANGALATTVLGVLTQYRGVAFTIGGDKTLKDIATLPNFLKKYNSKIRGYSVKVGLTGSESAYLNVAKPGATSYGIKKQAENLVEKLKEDPKININSDWKVITVFIGGNDLCAYCKDKEKHSASKYVENIRDTLDYLQKNVPRAFVNLVTAPNVTIMHQLTEGLSCKVLNFFECKCASYPESAEALEELKKVVDEYTTDTIALVETGRYDTKDDFTVVAQPFFKNTVPPLIKEDGKLVPDMSYFAPDCFHFSQKGHAAAAIALWNNMVERVGEKREEWTLGEPVECPTSKSPYFFTYKNSKRNTEPSLF